MTGPNARDPTPDVGQTSEDGNDPPKAQVFWKPSEQALVHGKKTRLHGPGDAPEQRDDNLETVRRSHPRRGHFLHIQTHSGHIHCRPRESGWAGIAALLRAMPKSTWRVFVAFAGLRW